MKTTKQGEIILNSTEAKVLLAYLNKQKANLNHDMDFVVDNMRVIMIMNEVSKENHQYNIM